MYIHPTDQEPVQYGPLAKRLHTTSKSDARVQAEVYQLIKYLTC